MQTDERIMKEVLRLAEKGRFGAHPNPMVGAVLVKDGKIIGRGYHQSFGGPHAEIELLSKVREEARGGTLYVNLEPCCHTGKTGPCTRAIIEAGISKVVIGDRDPNPLVSGKGIAMLENSGIEVKCGILEGVCRELNRAFYKFMTTGLPFVTAKVAQTIDGKISAGKNIRTNITGEAANEKTHELRASHDAVLIGSGTAKIDDPHLTVRLVKARNPVRIVLDSRLRLPPGLKIFDGLSDAPTLIVSSGGANAGNARKLKGKGVQVIHAEEDGLGRISIPSLLGMLAADYEISSLLVEGGARVFTTFLMENLADRWIFFLAPRVLPAGIPGFFRGNEPSGAVGDFKFVHAEQIGDDVMIEAESGKRFSENEKFAEK